MKTARMTIMLEPEEKTRIESRARGLAMSTGEYVRRASQSYNSEIDEATLEALAIEFAANVNAMHVTLREAVGYAQGRLNEIEAMRTGGHGNR